MIFCLFLYVPHWVCADINHHHYHRVVWLVFCKRVFDYLLDNTFWFGAISESYALWLSPLLVLVHSCNIFVFSVSLAVNRPVRSMHLFVHYNYYTVLSGSYWFRFPGILLSNSPEYEAGYELRYGLCFLCQFTPCMWCIIYSAQGSYHPTTAVVISSL